MQIWQTTEADKNCGVFESKKRTVVESFQKEKNLGSMEWNDEGRNEIKELTRDKIRSNRLYFLCLPSRFETRSNCCEQPAPGLRAS